MDQLNDFFVFLSTPEEASGIFSSWPAEMSFAVLADPEEGFTIVLFHRDQEAPILQRIARQRGLEEGAMRVVPEVDGYPTIKIGVSRELRIQKMVEAEKDLPERAGDYLLNYNCAKDLSPDEEYFGDDFADPDVDDTVPDGPQDDHTSDRPLPEMVPAGAKNEEPKGYLTVDDDIDLSTIWAQDMYLDRTEEGRVLLAVTSASAETKDAAEMVERLRLKVDGMGFFIAAEDLPELGSPCLEVPARLASIFINPTSGRPAKMRVLVSDEGWHVTAIPTPPPPPPAPTPVAPRPALTLPPIPEKPTWGRVMLNVAAGCVLATVLIALGAGGTLYLMPSATEAAQQQSPTLDDDYLDLLRTRIFETVKPTE